VIHICVKLFKQSGSAKKIKIKGNILPIMFTPRLINAAVGLKVTGCTTANPWDALVSEFYPGTVIEMGRVDGISPGTFPALLPGHQLLKVLLFLERPRI